MNIKKVSKNNIKAIIAMVIIISLLGVTNGVATIETISPVINLPKIAFAGFIAFFIVGIIMRASRKAGIWYGKTGGKILYAIVLALLGTLLFS